jgi:hypothetical protein
VAELDATVSGEDANTYLTLDEADALMDLHEAADDWDALEESSKARILATGTKVIDRYKNWLPPKVEGQALTFPTIRSNGIPQLVKHALVEYAAYKATADIDHLKKLQAEGVTNAATLGGTATMKADDSELPAGARKFLDIVWRQQNVPGVRTAPTNCRDEGHLF